MTNSINDLASADVLLLIGSNVTSAHPVIGMELNKGLRRGMKMIVVDPRVTTIARRADLHLRINPGTDVALLKGMMRLIIDEGIQNQDFILRRTEGLNDLVDSLEEMTVEQYAAICGVPVDDLVKAARMYAMEENSSICYCLGVTQHSHGVDNVRSVANLAMLTGNIGRPGVGVNPLRGANNVQGCCDMGGLPDLLPGYKKVEDAVSRGKYEQAWGVSLNPDPGLTVTEMIDACLCRDMKAMYIMGENPAISDPDVNHVVEALKKLDFLVVQDIFLTETAACADVVLPGATFAEKHGTFTNTERRVQRVHRALDPPGQARSDWRIVRDVANAMGAGWRYDSAKDVFNEARVVIDHQYGGIRYGRIERGGIQWPCPKDSHPGTAILHTDKFACGLGKLAAIDFIASAELPDEEYPFIFNTGRHMMHFHTGSMTRRSRGLDEMVPGPLADVNPADAGRLGIVSGDTVRITSRRGEISVKARVTGSTPEGSVFLPFHFAEAAANVLTNPERDPIAKIPELKVCAVRVEKVG